MTKAAKHRGARSPAGVPAAGAPAHGATGHTTPPAIGALRVLAGAGVVGVLVVAASLFRYPHALADDYSYAGKARLYGPAGAVVREYYNWTGRWACIGALTFSWSAMDLSDPWTYRATLLAFALVCAAAFHFFLCSALELRFFAARAVSLTLAFLALFWAGMLGPGEGVCWLSAVLGYQIGTAGILFVAAGLIRLGGAGRRARWVWLPLLALAAAFVPGTNELLGLVLCMVLGLGTLIALWKKIPSRWAWAAVLAAAAIGTLVVVIAPGNAVRRAQYPRSMDFAWAWDFLVSHLREYLPIWFGDGRLWAATFLLWMGADSVGLHPPWLQRKDVAWHFWIPLGTAAAIVAMFFVPAYATGDHLPVRAYNDIYLAFLIGWFLTVLAVRERLPAGGPAAPRGPAWTWAVSGWLVVVTVLYLLYGHAASEDLPNLPRKSGWLVPLGFGLAYAAAFVLWTVQPWGVPGAAGRGVLRAVLLLALPATLLWTGNTPRAFSDLTEKQAVRLQTSPGQPPAEVRRTRLEWYDFQMGMRRDLILRQAAAGGKHLVVPPIFIWPRTFFRSDLASDPRPWINREMCPFFGIESIRTLRPDEMR